MMWDGAGSGEGRALRRPGTQAKCTGLRPGRWGRWERPGEGAALTMPLPFRRRTDTSIACTMPEGALPAPVPVCVRFERRGCVHSNLTFQYMQNPVITAISPRRSPVR